jgi:outer membrane biosynthesis protein TonB
MFKHFEDQGHASYRMAESGNQIRIKIKPAAFKDITARFELKANSTAKQTREQQLQSVMDFWLFMGKLPNALDQYQQATGKVPDWEYTFGEIGKLMNLPFMGKMFTTATQPTTPAGQEPLPTAPQAQPPQAMPPQPAPVAPQPQMPPQSMPGGMPPAPQPQQPVQPDPEELAMVQAASPENPVIIGGYPFTNPQTAMQAYEMALIALTKSGGMPQQGAVA